MKNLPIILLVVFAGLVSCNQSSKKKESMCCDKTELGVKAENFDKTVDGKQIKLFTLENKNGMIVQITNYGGHLVSIITPDKTGKMADVCLGFATIDEYLAENIYMSGIIGRYGNRICKGKFELDGETYSLAINNAPNALHGGVVGYNKVIWDANQEGNKLVLTYVSPDGDQGYPGELTMTVTYELNDENEISMIYEATTDKTTVVNLTNHTFYNLKGDGDSTILDHKLQLFASKYTPVDSTLIPLGRVDEVAGTPLDFTQAKIIGDDINSDHEQVVRGFGFDHNWVIDQEKEGKMTLAVKLSEATTGRVMELSTTEPAVQFYAGNFFDGSATGKYGQKYVYRCALAVEPQHYPDSPNQPDFPSTVLKPGEKYYQKSVLKFYTE